MFARTFGEATYGLDGVLVTVEVDIANGLPAFDIVGLPDVAVKEARERVRAAIKNSGFSFPATRITVNLAPADVKKDGSGLDLPIAVGILAASGQICQLDCIEAVFIGELSLEGFIRDVSGVLPMAAHARSQGKKTLFLAGGNVAEAALAGGLTIYGADSVLDIVGHLNAEKTLDPAAPTDFKQFCQNAETADDFSDVQGQRMAKRAMEIAAAGGHNIMLVGSPGSGKTMLARRMPGILPAMTEQESLEVTKIYSVAGLLSKKDGPVLTRPFRSPHHTISYGGLIGGGRIPKPGEVTLSHNGVLFLDEFPEFSRLALEALRQPLEDGEVSIARVQASLRYPARFILVAAMNPCPCGYQGDPTHACSCGAADIERYRKRLSGPLLDRIDLQVRVPRMEYKEIKGGEQPPELSRAIRARVQEARERQLARFDGQGLYCNGHMGHKEIKKHCALSRAAEQLLEKAFDSLGLSARSHDRIIKVAQTIADLDHASTIESKHLAEAVQLRTNFKA
ncbi:MAG: YifB family Mg chelatase-like AAA ATPase [Acidaminococcales bacterium]|nr:YifB family Mg chelatase-like AAA ATPase [Acidaminococcales bacterium]